MKTGRTLTQLAEEVERQAQSKKDYIASTRDMRIVPRTDGTAGVKLELGGKGGELLDVGQTAHEQIATQAGIPRDYYKRMLAERPELLATNVNTWFYADPTPRMLRTLDGRARAMLSDKFRPLDNYELLEAALPAMQSANLEIVSCEVTERRLYVKAVDRAIQRHIPAGFHMGDGSHVAFRVPNGEVIPALQFGNSEIGSGALSVVGGYLDGGCTNLMWSFRDRGMRRTHLGGRLEVGDDLYRILSEETRRVTDQSIWMQFRDAIKAAISVEGFDALCDTLRVAAGEQITGDPAKVVEVTAKRFNLTDGQRIGVLQHLIRGGDLSKFGLANAITSVANDTDDYDMATDLERMGGQIIELPKQDWTAIAVAA